ncbi:MAG: serpin family protein [Sedimentisphaerales bacterium]|nr:serpin family protein [Sedimentisphaerales bacterium]
MKAIKYVLILTVLGGMVNGCWAAEKISEDQKTAQQAVVKGNNEFALELYAKLRTQEGNLFFSPYSISTALAMAYAGARGETESQMAKALHFSTTPSTAGGFASEFGAIVKDLNVRGAKGGYELNVANALWGQRGYGFLAEFLEPIKNNYGGELNEVDFINASETARQTINSWVEKQTRNKIKDLIQQGMLNSMTRLVLTNAIYFKGNWARQFEKDKTKESPFTLISGKEFNVPMMNQTAEFNYMEADDFQGLELPYVNDELSMIILLPRKVDGLSSLEEKLVLEKFSGWLSELGKRKVIVSIPKFKMTSQFGLADVLRSMGMTDAFSVKADFSGMNGKRDIFISAVIHKAYVDVYEEGTEAAAATAVIMKTTSVMPGQIPVFRADHPFLFLIRDNKSGSILFIGRAMNPAA